MELAAANGSFKRRRQPVFGECLGEFGVRKLPKGELGSSSTGGEDMSEEIPKLPAGLGRVQSFVLRGLRRARREMLVLEVGFELREGVGGRKGSLGVHSD